MPQLSLGPLRAGVMTAAGLVMALSPLALWIAWNETVFLLVLATCVVSGGLFCTLLALEKDPDEAPGGSPRGRTMEPLDDDLLGAISNMGPWIYHNRHADNPEFQQKMETLKKKMKRKGEGSVLPSDA